MQKISVVLPCLNEEQSIDICIDQVLQAMSENALAGEILVVDNGSTDQSAPIIRRRIADNRPASPVQIRMFQELKKGYGSAYRSGFADASHDYVFMADSDGTYDFGDIPKFMRKLDEGFDLVIGNRFARKMELGVMPLHRKYIGNPFLSFLVQKIFSIQIKDIHCGARAFKNGAVQNLNLISDGMELASEMIIKASKQGLRITELPTGYKKRIGDSKLRSLRDGMRHVICIIRNMK